MNERSEREKRLLMVLDDEPGLRGFVCGAASDLGPKVLSASNGASAREAYPALRPDVILLDSVMPEVGGSEFMRWLAQRRATSRLILVTGCNPNYGESTTKLTAALGLPDTAFLAKPVRLRTLVEALHEPDPAGEERRSP